MNQTQKNFKFWMDNAPLFVKSHLAVMTQEEIDDAFTNEMTFGTAGVRGPISWGTNYINLYTISKFTYGFGKVILELYKEKAKTEGVVIFHDNRRMRMEFSYTAAKILSAMGIKVSLFENNELQPTPLLSYVIANNSFVGGINITASHNPPTDNGFKVYNHEGVQMSEEETKKIQKYTEEISKEGASLTYFNLPQDTHNISYIGQSYVDQWVQRIMSTIPFEPLDTDRKDLRVVFSASNGTAGKHAKRFLENMNVTFFMQEEQYTPDENFIASPKPNPQYMESYEYSLQDAKMNRCELVFVSDPDADRFGIMVKDSKDGQFKHINGNELPALQLYYKLSRLKELNQLNPSKDFMVRSVVSSRFADQIAKDFGINSYETLIGFKWIIGKALKLEAQGGRMILGWEEAYGSCSQSYTRDKDSFQALVQVVEMAYYYKKQNKTLLDVLAELFKKYGNYHTDQIMKRFEGIQGQQDMLKLVESYRTHPPKSIAGYKVKEVIDFKNGHKEVAPQNFISLILENDSVISIRPSGTEPILRFYFDIRDYDLNKIKEVFK